MPEAPAFTEIPNSYLLYALWQLSAKFGVFSDGTIKYHIGECNRGIIITEFFYTIASILLKFGRNSKERIKYIFLIGMLYNF